MPQTPLPMPLRFAKISSRSSGGSSIPFWTLLPILSIHALQARASSDLVAFGIVSNSATRCEVSFRVNLKLITSFLCSSLEHIVIPCTWYCLGDLHGEFGWQITRIQYPSNRNRIKELKNNREPATRRSRDHVAFKLVMNLKNILKCCSIRLGNLW